MFSSKLVRLPPATGARLSQLTFAKIGVASSPVLRSRSGDYICAQCARIEVRFASQVRRPAPSLRPKKQVYYQHDTPVESVVPPQSLLRSAAQSLGPKFQVDNVTNFILRYAELSQKQPRGWEQQLLSDFNVTPEFFTQVSLIMARGGGAQRLHLAQHMLSTASKLGDLDATLLLLRTALKRGAINEPYCSWHIDRLKEKSATNAAAALLYGRISEATGKEDQALDLYRRAYALSTSTSTDDAVTPPPPSTSPPTLQPPPDQQVSSQALTHAALLYAKHGHHTAATSLFQRAAHLHSSPLASFHLAQQADPGSSEQEEYLLKAASAGIPAAAGELGRLYVGRARGGKGAEAEVCRKRAKEWLLVAVAGEYDRDSSQSESESEGAWSMVLLGDLLAVEGKEGREQALGWYKRVEEVALDEKAVESARRSMEELEKGGSVPASSGKA